MPDEEPRSLLFDPESAVVADTAVLQSLAHPLRSRLLGLLRTHGPSTASKLAERCAESSGLTSYHLRHLAAAGLIEEARPADLAGRTRTGGRERWWKATHQTTWLQPPPAGDDDAEAATADFQRVMLASLTDRARSWLSVAHTWPAGWREFGGFSDLLLRLTADEARELNRDIEDVLARYRRHDPMGGEAPPDAAIVTLQYQLFPLADQEPPVADQEPPA